MEILDQAWYERLKQSKIHRTQKDLGNRRIQIQVYETPELYRLILSFGQDVRIIEPKSIKKAVKEKLLDTLKKY